MSFSVSNNSSPVGGPSEVTAIAGMRIKKGKLLGKGAFGAVYQAMNTMSGELLAIKQLPIAHDVTAHTLRGIEREIAINSSLPPHSHCVRYLGMQSTPRNIYIVMEHVSGGSIQALLQSVGQFHERTMRSYSAMVLLGLQHLHHNNVIHQDIKGANVLIDEKGVAKIADFGCSKDLSTAAASGTFGGAGGHGGGGSSATFHNAGTPLWMAPEVCRGEPATKSSDVWSFGCLLMEMVTPERSPWVFAPGTSAFAVLYAIGAASKPPQPPAHLSSAARDFISRCLVLDASRRPTVDELLQHPFITSGTGQYPSAGLSSKISNLNAAGTKLLSPTSCVSAKSAQPEPGSSRPYGTTPTPQTAPSSPMPDWEGYSASSMNPEAHGGPAHTGARGNEVQHLRGGSYSCVDIDRSAASSSSSYPANHAGRGHTYTYSDTDQGGRSAMVCIDGAGASSPASPYDTIGGPEGMGIGGDGTIGIVPRTGPQKINLREIYLGSGEAGAGRRDANGQQRGWPLDSLRFGNEVHPPQKGAAARGLAEESSGGGGTAPGTRSAEFVLNAVDDDDDDEGTGVTYAHANDKPSPQQQQAANVLLTNQYRSEQQAIETIGYERSEYAEHNARGGPSRLTSANTGIGHATHTNTQPYARVGRYASISGVADDLASSDEDAEEEDGVRPCSKGADGEADRVRRARRGEISEDDDDDALGSLKYPYARETIHASEATQFSGVRHGQHFMQPLPASGTTASMSATSTRPAAFLYPSSPSQAIQNVPIERVDNYGNARTYYYNSGGSGMVASPLGARGPFNNNDSSLSLSAAEGCVVLAAGTITGVGYAPHYGDAPCNVEYDEAGYFSTRELRACGDGDVHNKGVTQDLVDESDPEMGDGTVVWHSGKEDALDGSNMLFHTEEVGIGRSHMLKNKNIPSETNRIASFLTKKFNCILPTVDNTAKKKKI